MGIVQGDGTCVTVSTTSGSYGINSKWQNTHSRTWEHHRDRSHPVSKNVRRTHTRLTFGSQSIVQCHTQTHRGRNQCSWHAHGFHFFFGSHRAASQGTQPFDVLQRKAQQGRQTLNPETSRILIGRTLTVEHPDWPNCKATAEAGKRARLQCRIPRETKCHHRMFIKDIIHTT